jgi:hypothetical protein
MGAPEACPHCGAVRGDVTDPRGPMEALYDEVARIREIAERQQSDEEIIARLTREVQTLRETVALLRGTTHRAAATGGRRVHSPAA